MPYCRRMDWPGALHHVISRGVNGMSILECSGDKRRMMRLMERYVPAAGSCIHAWALMDNHFHLLVQTGNVPLSSLMQRFLTAYAMGYNCSRNRNGRVFMGRYRSILVDSESYYLKLMAYINTNPYRAGIIDSLEELDSYPFAGHAYGSGARERYSWELDPCVTGKENRDDYIEEARKISTSFDDGETHHHSEQFPIATVSSSGIQRGFAEQQPVHQMGYEKQSAIGSNLFIVEALRSETERRLKTLRTRQWQHDMAEKGLIELCAKTAISQAELRGGSRRKLVVEVRCSFIRYLVLSCGFTFSDAARFLGKTRQSIAASFNKSQKGHSRNILSCNE